MDQLQKTELFDGWLHSLRDVRAKAKILVRLKRAELGNLGDVKNIGKGILEMRIDYGPGYRMYFTRKKGNIVLLLIGGDKSSQARDIKKAQQLASEIGS
ncbi:MAG: type II toxin-antitoxin system RelE/ParE family toxin [Chitinispirillaceae bacterium]|nr:type II toxin-antitoxin system RelE/ParE family toxin [Chitinispirillaceae bacterium]